MLYNINILYLQCVFHGIRFKVNEDWLSGDNHFFCLYFYINKSYTPTIRHHFKQKKESTASIYHHHRKELIFANTQKKSYTLILIEQIRQSNKVL